ncbi:hypothetical protein CIG75_00350 [Tumebacillus algifaecis]|uniref:t-SNARE coiled-coil homology domain-containing protein n=1 Tax=Tumebacillus algifaecis TaxID=1214604 RepID=A0A223CWL0_9BACL|nr:hypothetical protein [Tumebacillus algifaecis]ASS73574.1 hypothetical protein CIG75_00350 [Tumebacillus algifaecis]
MSTERFDRLENRFDGVDKQLVEHGVRFDRIEDRLDGVEKQMVEHGMRFDRIEKQLAEHDARFDRIEKMFNNRFDQLERMISGLIAQVALQNQKIDYALSEIQKLHGQHGRLSQRVAHLESNGFRVEQVERRQDNHAARLDKVEVEVAVLQEEPQRVPVETAS